MTASALPQPGARASARDGLHGPPLNKLLTGPLLAPLGLLVLINSVGTAALLPAVRHALAGTPTGLRTIETAIWVTAAASPLLGFAAAALVAVCLWSALALGGREAPWRPLLAVALYAEAAFALQSLFIAGVLHMRGLATLRAPADLQVPTGLDIYFEASSPAVLVLAQHLGLFYLAWVGVLAWGTRTAANTSWPKALVAALAPWTLGVIYAVTRTGI